MTPESGVNHQTRSDLESTVDDLCLAGHYLALDLQYGLRRVSTDRGARAGLLWGPDLGPVVGIDVIPRPDGPAVEVGRVVEEEVDLIELLLLDVQHSVRERVELPGVVPVTVSNNDPGEGRATQSAVFHLVGQVPPAAR